jgi:hypothetical protein
MAAFNALDQPTFSGFHVFGLSLSLFSLGSPTAFSNTKGTEEQKRRQQDDEQYATICNTN